MYDYFSLYFDNKYIVLKMAKVRYNKLSIAVEIILRIALFIFFIYLDYLSPFQRFIPQEELENDLKYPRHDSYVPSAVLWITIAVVPTVLAICCYAFWRVPNDLLEGFFSLTLALGLNGLLTNCIKLAVGRPRPDYFYRCFPNGEMSPDLSCTGNETDIIDGRKSFPSGHSSFAFCAYGFVSLWLCGRMSVFSRRGRRKGLRLVLGLSPLLVAALVAISRTCDYHHHWQDVLAGSILGYSLAYLCYRHHYNALTSDLSGIPYCNSTTNDGEVASDQTPLLGHYNGGLKISTN